MLHNAKQIRQRVFLKRVPLRDVDIKNIVVETKKYPLIRGRHAAVDGWLAGAFALVKQRGRQHRGTGLGQPFLNGSVFGFNDAKHGGLYINAMGFSREQVVAKTRQSLFRSHVEIIAGEETDRIAVVPTHFFKDRRNKKLRFSFFGQQRERGRFVQLISQNLAGLNGGNSLK